MYNQILFFERLTFPTFMKKEEEFKDLLLNIHFDFRQYLVDDAKKLSEKQQYDILREEFTELIWLFIRREENEFKLFIEYGIQLLNRSSKDEDFKKMMNYLKGLQNFSKLKLTTIYKFFIPIGFVTLKNKLIKDLIINHEKNRQLLFSFIENYISVLNIKYPINHIHLNRAIYGLRKDSESVEFLINLYRKSGFEAYKDVIVGTLEVLAFSNKIPEKHKEKVFEIFGTRSNYALPENCDIVKMKDFEIEIQKRLEGKKRNIWLDYNDLVCLNLDIGQIKDDQISFGIHVISKNQNYILNKYIVPDTRIFIVLNSLVVEKNDNVHEILLKFVDTILNQLFSFQNISFSEFKKRIKEFNELLIKICCRFNNTQLNLKSFNKKLDDYEVNQYIQLLWLFKDSKDFHLFVSYGITLLTKTKMKFNFHENLKYLGHLLTTTPNDGYQD